MDIFCMMIRDVNKYFLSLNSQNSHYLGRGFSSSSQGDELRQVLERTQPAGMYNIKNFRVDGRPLKRCFSTIFVDMGSVLP